MKKTELEKCPQWLIDANTCDEHVEWGNGPNSWIVWRGGDWLGGDWHGGVWRGGDWHGGDWRGGDWHGGVWHGGVWHGGVWLGGVWRGGDWLGGVWHGGVWLGGVWLGGVWRLGSSSIRSKYTPRMMENGKLKIGCQEKTIKEWDKWFKGKDEFSTKRGTVDFKMIHAHFLAAKAYFNAMSEK